MHQPTALLATILAATAAAHPSAQSAHAGTLFQGNSIVIQPHNTSHHPADATIWAANFYCYMTEKGYFSFGWWLPANATSTHEHCTPDSKEFDWYEYSNEGSCNGSTCRVHAINYHNDGSTLPDIDTHYVAGLVDVGDGVMGSLAVSYFDEDGGAFGVGTRRILSKSDSEKEIDECHTAFRTLKKLQTKHKLPLPFKIEDPCGNRLGYESVQKVFSDL
ncbi:hypothetical protein PT974_01653 [Cladobotryum mycophilum]|uniref:Ecp2 effector protein domain-containing protein n=1 Tax=Cladobotryum mycophilum TaxID=491253 RepID=A0ABR0T5F0_9HYPO